MKLKNIEELIDNEGEITIGRIGPVQCGASASDDANCLAMLARRPSESFEALLIRLDASIKEAIEHEIFADEINH